MIPGISTANCQAIQSVLKEHPRLERAVLFGSRAMGTYTETSDIDIALEGDLTLTDHAELAEKLDRLAIAQKTDLVRVSTVTNDDLLDHLQRHGRVLYQKL